MAAGQRRAALAGRIVRTLARAPTPQVRVPRAVVDSLFAARRRAAGLHRRVARVGGFEIPFLEGGSGAPLVLLHGFSDTKDSFVDVAPALVRRYRVVLPDLPGFSEASRPLDFRYSLNNLVEVFTGFAEGLGLDRFHLGGNSLGGAVAAAYALSFPARVRSLVLIGAAGVVPPRPSPLQLALEAGRNPFVCSTTAEHDALLRLVFETPPAIPGPVLSHLAHEYIERGPMNAKILDDLLADDVDLTPRLNEIRVETLLLWGDRDRLVDLSAGHVYHREIPRARLVILHGVGHCPQYEVPHRTARLLRRFVGGGA